MKAYENFYINGEWVRSEGTGTMDVIDSATEEVIGRVPEGSAADVDAAVAAAKAAFETWSQTPVDVRAKYLRDIGAALAGRYDDIVDVITSEVGSPKAFAQMVQAGLSLGEWETFAKLVEGYAFEEQVGNSLVVREPIGVVGAITPWNYPLYLIICKVVPALAAGCTVVLKPSEVTPLNAYILAEVLDEVGLPKGVFNLVVGTGPEVGAAISGHPDVDMVSFTGSGRAGAEVTKAAAPTAKRVGLELGGKSANVVLDDADPTAVAMGAVFGCYINSGQTCSALTRLLVPESRKQEYIDAVLEEASKVGLVDPKADEPDLFHNLGPLSSKAHQERVRSYIQKGIDEGATLALGGPEQPEGFEKGFYVKPTVFTDVTPDMTIAQEEIFGPVLSILTYTDDDDAVAIANGTVYGLAGAVQSADVERAKGIARRLRTGQVDVNGAPFNTEAPFGGYKQSGNTRERGRWGLEEFLETKSIQLPV
ncbi:aldehyde dehydrogenase family protein [Dermatobacter hominis]|uniref:aldehyde dehydrogenase family protein n=1 Tax=Dermatobacter hominis TaxID=2884263 RepID=UPI001D100CD1|nr:aldehyde dehydrogenase family protein [Dermatobacter hominis]UDY37935.1 aldehyde dehydrogenase family protein [Dermatobacter hominis]